MFSKEACHYDEDISSKATAHAQLFTTTSRLREDITKIRNITDEKIAM
jgi:hypothetical protein